VAIPTPIVEIAFNDTPYVNNPTWTDVTTYVRSIDTSRGRTDDFADFDTGTASVVLDNRSRLFDPFYTAGTYYGKLLPRRQIRIRAKLRRHHLRHLSRLRLRMASHLHRSRQRLDSHFAMFRRARSSRIRASVGRQLPDRDPLDQSSSILEM
jgi:hypothetical protein